MRRLKRELRPVHDSKGVHIPQALLEHLGLEGKLEIAITDGRIEIRAAGDPEKEHIQELIRKANQITRPRK
jgi:antitoxin component of MazEF toxin-antitoxin module